MRYICFNTLMMYTPNSDIFNCVSDNNAFIG